jgi:ribosome maturation factor RimP
MARLPDELVTRLERLAASEGLELLAVDVGGTARLPVVRLVLDREQGGVSLADCESVSRQASVLLDVHDPFPGAFTLEVSSPGIERKLYKDNDFTRFVGRAVRVRMKPTWPAPRAIQGFLEGRADGAIRVRDLAGVTHELPEPEVFETRLAPHLEESEMKPKHRGRK